MQVRLHAIERYIDRFCPAFRWFGVSRWKAIRVIEKQIKKMWEEGVPLIGRFLFDESRFRR